MTLAEFNTKIQADLEVIDQVRQKLNALFIAAMKTNMLPDTLTFITEIGTLAAGGTNPALILQTIGTFTQLNSDLNQAILAVKAQTPPTT